MRSLLPLLPLPRQPRHNITGMAAIIAVITAAITGVIITGAIITEVFIIEVTEVIMAITAIIIIIMTPITRDIRAVIPNVVMILIMTARYWCESAAKHCIDRGRGGRARRPFSMLAIGGDLSHKPAP